jgi:tetratricopeptide (TPR) repeat protein
LGAGASNLAAISWFFDRPYESPSEALAPPTRAFVLAEASLYLRAQGRLQESLPAIRAALRLAEEAKHWENAASAASNLSEIESMLGDVATAIATGENAIALADRSGEAFEMMSDRITLADALHAAGEWTRASTLFDDAERQLRKLQPQHPSLYGIGGFWRGEFLLSQGQAQEALRRATYALEVARRNNQLLSIALDNLTLGRSHLALVQQGAAGAPLAAPTSEDLRSGPAKLDVAVDGLRALGQNDHLPRGLIARAAFRRANGDWEGAKRDLDEAKEIAEPGQMRLYLCDCALERARLAFAQREAFAPLAGLVAPSSPPVLPDPSDAAALSEEAREQLDVARKLIAECGYHRRDEELAELDAVTAGRRLFADLPPRV